MNRLLTFAFLVFSGQILFGQSLAEMESVLETKLIALRAAKTEEEISFHNEAFKKSMSDFLKEPSAFNYIFQKLKTVAVLDSPDGKVRIVNWNLEHQDMSYSFCAFVLRKDENKDKIIVTELVDNLDAYESKPEGTIEAKNWYGALYYKIIPFERNNKMEYLLIGWDGGTTGSNFKILDVLTFSGNNVKLGSPVFKGKKTTMRRVIFEYSDRSNMVVRFEEKYGRIVFDHLSPESPALAGVYSYYVPDMSYDAYVYADGEWILNEDIIATNPDEGNESKYFYSLNSKTGKAEKVKMKSSWIDPTDIKHEQDIKHVARTPESEAAEKMANQPIYVETKQKRRFWDRRRPESLSVTMGKSRKKGRTTKRLP